MPGLLLNPNNDIIYNIKGPIVHNNINTISSNCDNIMTEYVDYSDNN